MICKYDVCWKGECGDEVIDLATFCHKHEILKCSKCGKPAVGDCHKYNGSFVCAAPLCKKCKCGHE